MSETNQIVVVPHIENTIPIPKNNAEALPDMTSEEEIQARTNTIKLLSKPEFGNYPNETMAYLAGMVAQTNCMLVKDMADFKLHVLNRAVQEAETAKSSRERLAALRMIGEIDGVDAFKKQTVITHINKSGDELEKELLKTIEELKGTIIEGTHEIVDDD